jgi:hypothetical protein
MMLMRVRPAAVLLASVFGCLLVTLKFNDERLRGYTIAVRREREAQLSAAAPRLLQTPPASDSRSARTASVTFHSCMMGFACMTVQPL